MSRLFNLYNCYKLFFSKYYDFTFFTGQFSFLAIRNGISIKIYIDCYSLSDINLYYHRIFIHTTCVCTRVAVSTSTVIKNAHKWLNRPNKSSRS